jgi:hypothetical protein
MKTYFTGGRFFSTLSVLLILVVFLGMGLCSSCSRHRQEIDTPSAGSPPATDLGTNGDQGWGSIDYQRQKEAALAYAEKVREERLGNPPTNEVALPNPEGGPGMPFPIGVDFYETDPRYPEYLWCAYDVSEKHYDPSKEPQWFEAALLQVRAHGPKRFPPIKWVAVVIVNRAEHRGASTFEQCFKAGAIFRASEVFDSENDLRKTISRADVDRHPFRYDPQQPTPREQQRWVVVERHAATNHTATGSQQVNGNH